MSQQTQRTEEDFNTIQEYQAYLIGIWEGITWSIKNIGGKNDDS